MKKLSILFISIIAILYSCKEDHFSKVQFTGVAQGTYYAVTYFDNQNRDFQSELDSLLKEFDQSVSVYQPNSIVSKVNRNEDIELDEWFIDNFNLSQQVSKETDGAFDLTIAPIANVWGFGTFQKPDSVNHHLIDSLKQIVDYRKVSVFNKRLIKEDSRIMLNFNAVAQGFAVDVMGEFLLSQGIENFLIDLGGEIYAKGSKPNGDPWKIGIEIPEDGAEERFYNRIVSLKDEAVATSGNYRKFYELDGVKYAHSLNPKTGYPVRHSLLSTTVIAPTAGEADAYATAFMVMGVDATLEFIKSKPNLKVYLMYDDAGEIKTAMSPNFEKYISAGSE
jgi:thiamine biosynthesis lipoprotein